MKEVINTMSVEETVDIELQRHQKRAVEALKVLDTICKKHNIEYFLLAGSVLGAVRHKGFIPWDDDIDIGMTLPNIEAFQSVIRKELPADYHYMDRNDNRYPRLFGKITFNNRGCIDIFPVVKTSSNVLLQATQWIIRKVTFKIYKQKLGYVNINERHGLLKICKRYGAKVVAFFISQKRIVRIIEWNEYRFENTHSGLYLNLYSAYSMKKEIIYDSWLSPLGTVCFEEANYPAVNNVKAYLTHLYGDYMQLPPEDKRYCGHEEIF